MTDIIRKLKEKEQNQINGEQMKKIWSNFYPHSNRGEVIGSESSTAFELFTKMTEKYPNNIALKLEGQQLTYRQLDDYIARFASSLFHLLKVRKGDRVAIFLPNSAEFIVAFYSILKTGGIVVPISFSLTQNNFRFILQDSEPKLIIAPDSHYSQVKDAAQNTSVERIVLTAFDELATKENYVDEGESGYTSDKNGVIINFGNMLKNKPFTFPSQINLAADPAILAYTSGTTAQMKGAVLTHMNSFSNLVQEKRVMGDLLVEGKELLIASLPFFHIYGMTLVMQFALANGCTLIIPPRMNLKEIFQQIEKEKVTILFGVPSLYTAMVQDSFFKTNDLGSLKVAFCGSDTLNEDIAKRFKEFTGLDIVEGYGLTEASPLTHANIPKRIKSGSIGLPVPGTLSWIIQPESLRFLNIGETGELVVSGPQVMKEYWNRPEENRLAFFNAYGLTWLRTGDITRVDEEGYFYFVERTKDTVKYKGQSVFSQEIEQVLSSHPNVAASAVIGLPNARFGEEIVAVIVPKDRHTITVQQITEHCNGKLPRQMIPTRIFFRENMPFTTTGKISKSALRQELSSIS